LDAFVSLSEQDLQKLKKINKNSYVVPNSVSLFPEKPALLENKIILSVGRMDYNKGYDLLLDVFEKLTLICPDWNLRIVGEGPLRKKIISRIETSDLKDHVEIFPPTNQIIDQYLMASIYVMTSRTEGLGMVLLEAQACGLPIVSFDCDTGPSDIITDNKNGFLVKCFDVERMVQRIALLCSDCDLRMKFGKSAIEDVKKFHPETINSKWENLFEELFKQ
jgi:glycosyltransferase involved in cell wall biosynthesis